MWVIESFGDGPRRKGDDKKRGFSGWSKSKAALDARILEAQGEALPAWTVHDIRRSAATAMADRLGVLPHIVEAVLNHVSGHRAGVAGIYNRARYAEEMRDALERWSAGANTWRPLLAMQVASCRPLTNLRRRWGWKDLPTALPEVSV
ncbi:hypothetical protein WN73_18470 [Bradyrhizobium sp. CCBAU 45394]|nr:hypothetical protein [Bradyrhizobium sp. CCBAU 45394]MDA9534788.1 hypothetical protein [Bradyrhizobium sp. CCBAU 21362]